MCATNAGTLSLFAFYVPGKIRVKNKWWRLLGRVLIGVLVLGDLLYLGDWAVLRFRVGRGTAYGVVTVTQFLATPLKGNKIEYDLMGTAQVTCSRSIFPHDEKPACWWVERHKAHWE